MAYAAVNYVNQKHENRDTDLSFCRGSAAPTETPELCIPAVVNAVSCFITLVIQYFWLLFVVFQ